MSGFCKSGHIYQRTGFNIYTSVNLCTLNKSTTQTQRQTETNTRLHLLMHTQTQTHTNISEDYLQTNFVDIWIYPSNSTKMTVKNTQNSILLVNDRGYYKF